MFLSKKIDRDDQIMRRDLLLKEKMTETEMLNGEVAQSPKNRNVKKSLFPDEPQASQT